MGEIEIRPIQTEHEIEYRLLLDLAFDLTPPAHYLSNFPVWNPSLTKLKERFQFGGWEGNRLVTTASMRIADYRIDEKTSEKVGLIGAVATHPNQAGRGYAGSVLDRLLQEGRSRGVRAFVLWGAPSSLYSKRGFRFGGVQLRTPLEQILLAGEVPQGYDILAGWDEVIAENFLNRKSGIQYGDSDVLWLYRHEGVEWRTLWYDEKCVAHCGWNRGIDLPNIIHELGGTQEGKRALLHFMKRRYPALELLHHPKDFEFGVRAISPTENLAQFLFDGPGHPLEKNIDSLWFSGMDSC